MVMIWWFTNSLHPSNRILFSSLSSQPFKIVAVMCIFTCPLTLHLASLSKAFCCSLGKDHPHFSRNAPPIVCSRLGVSFLALVVFGLRERTSPRAILRSPIKMRCICCLTLAKRLRQRQERVASKLVTKGRFSNSSTHSFSSWLSLTASSHHLRMTRMAEAS